MPKACVEYHLLDYKLVSNSYNSLTHISPATGAVRARSAQYPSYPSVGSRAGTKDTGTECKQVQGPEPAISLPGTECTLHSDKRKIEEERRVQ